MFHQDGERIHLRIQNHEKLLVRRLLKRSLTQFLVLPQNRQRLFSKRGCEYVRHAEILPRIQGHTGSEPTFTGKVCCFTRAKSSAVLLNGFVALSPFSPKR